MHAFGAGGPSVDTVLETPECLPGGTLRGVVHLQAGDRTVEIEQLTVALHARVEVEGGEHEHSSGVEFQRIPVGGRFTLEAGGQHAIPFEFPVPWEAPVTAVNGQPLYGMAVGLRTEVKVAKAVDPGDLDPVAITPLPAQRFFLDALARLGFGFKGADLEYGHLRGVSQQLPFYQEIEFYAPPQYGGRISELELTFVAAPHGMDVVFEVDKRGGFFGGSHDTYHHVHVDYMSAEQTDWAAYIDGWLQQLLSGAGPAFGSHGSHGHHGRRSPGMGAVLGGAAVGVAGGLIAGEVLEEVFEDDGDEGDFDF
jgi:sporulation-control protein